MLLLRRGSRCGPVRRDSRRSRPPGENDVPECLGVPGPLEGDRPVLFGRQDLDVPVREPASPERCAGARVPNLVERNPGDPSREDPGLPDDPHGRDRELVERVDGGPKGDDDEADRGADGGKADEGRRSPRQGTATAPESPSLERFRPPAALSEWWACGKPGP